MFFHIVAVNMVLVKSSAASKCINRDGLAIEYAVDSNVLPATIEGYIVPTCFSQGCRESIFMSTLSQ